MVPAGLVSKSYSMHTRHLVMHAATSAQTHTVYLNGEDALRDGSGDTGSWGQGGEGRQREAAGTGGASNAALGVVLADGWLAGLEEHLLAV